MSLGSAQKRGSRVANIHLQPNHFEIAWDVLKRADVLTRIGMCGLAAVLIWLITAGWQPPFAFRHGVVPPRDIAARVEFHTQNEEKTEREREQTRTNFVTIYRNDEQGQAIQLRAKLLDDVRLVLRAKSWEALSQDEKGLEVWGNFMRGLTPLDDVPGAQSEESPPQSPPAIRFDAFRNALADDPELDRIEEVLTSIMNPIFEAGILEQLQHNYDPTGGSQFEIRVAIGDDNFRRTSVSEVKLESVREKLRLRIQQLLPSPLSDHIAAWLLIDDRLHETLKFDPDATAKYKQEAVAAVPFVMDDYLKGAKLAEGGVPLSAEAIALLRREHGALIRELTLLQRLGRTLTNFAMQFAIFSICGFYSVFRRSHVLMHTPTLARVLCLAVVTLALCWYAPIERSETIIVPLLLYAMTIVIAYDQELALLLSTVMALVVVVSLGFGIPEFTIYVATMSTAVLSLRHVRSRTKLIYVGLTTAAVAATTAIGAITLANSGGGIPMLTAAAWYGFFSVIAGLLMTGLLPFIENLFDIQTELSLLELGDVAHPLLQELVRRAPGTYNHTINVASIAEAAADAVGANGLLVRVGAYFHDIGKMLKPSYFIENQGDGGNRHESLLPAMSTLVIIAHVKDGADLARQHGLPNSLVDFIQQHHGTTLVEYFYNRASEQNVANPNGGEVDEHSYRYPGPKPQSKEAAVLMLADAVESACRALSDPTPSRIEGLVRDLAMKRLLDGQFNACGLTLQELHKIELSLVKSLSAVYHARIKYPDTQTA